MSPADLPPDLLSKSLPELLQIIRLGTYTTDILDAIKKRVKELWSKKQYGFTPDAKTAKELQNITKSDAYRRMEECVGKTSYLNIVKLGLKIEDLSYKLGSAEIENIRKDVFNKYGKDGINILNMGNNGALLPLIQYLSDLKIKNNYSQEGMLNHFMEVIHDWERITIFHKTENGIDGLTDTIKRFMSSRQELFFVFAIGSAGDQAKKAISSLSNDDTIHEQGYTLTLHLREMDQKNRVHFGWTFQQLNPFAIEKFTL
ncbi:MAG: hypothetical protein AWU58_740 [Methanohalophilus sp. T328-1]|nr:MAG: hypothetical protein AWU58_740 [Methanohalophilus sp. T328-1]